MLSPYFSPGQRKICRPSLDRISIHREHDEDQVTNTDPGPVARTGDQFDESLLNDPMFRFYFRKFLNLYQQLSVLKPNLIQESVASDPWKLLVAVTLLNKTTAKVAIPVFWELLERWPTPWAMSQANQHELGNHIHCLGTYNVRSRRLIEISSAYVRDPPRGHDSRPSRPTSPTKRQSTYTMIRRNERYPPTPISHLPGTGPYALDSYRIFCPSHNDPLCEEWKAVLPTDKELILYLRWRWAYEEQKEWSPLTGRITPADIPFLESLVKQLTVYRARQKQDRENIMKHCNHPCEYF